MSRKSPRAPHQSLVLGHAMLFILMAVNVVAFVAQSLLPETAWSGWECVPVDVEAAWDALVAGRLAEVDWQSLATLLTAAFLHADIEHLAFNMLFLWVFGFLAGELLGQTWVLVIYVLTAVGGSLEYVIFDSGSAIPMLGASGAVLGFQGAYLGLLVRCRLPDPFVWPLAHPVSPLHLGIFSVIGIFLDLSGVINPGDSNVAFAAHLGGFLTGVFLTSFVTPRARGELGR